MSDPKISVVIVSARRRQALNECLEALGNQEDPPPWELLVAANGDPEVSEQVMDLFPEATIRTVERTHPGRARNAVVGLASGEIVLFLDDDVVPERDLLRLLSDLADEHPDIGIFGGPNLTPPGSSTFQVVQGAVLASIISSGPVRRRYGPHPLALADERFFMLCNLAIRRSELIAFDDTLICAEENRLMDELQARGVTMLYDPGLRVFHDRRPDVKAFASQLFKYGVGRGQICRRDPSSARPAHLAPVVLIAWLAVLPLLGMRSPRWLLAGGAYGALLSLNGVVVAATLRKPSALPAAAALTGLVHITYGAGIVIGFAKGGRREPFRGQR